MVSNKRPASPTIHAPAAEYKFEYTRDQLNKFNDLFLNTPVGDIIGTLRLLSYLFYFDLEFFRSITRRSVNERERLEPPLPDHWPLSEGREQVPFRFASRCPFVFSLLMLE